MRKLKTIEMHRLTVDEFKAAEKLPLIVVLDNVRSLYNVGSVFRTADAFRVEAVWLCGVTGCPPNAEIHKTALGGEDSVDWRYFKDTQEAVRELHDKGYFVWSVEQVEGSTKLDKLADSALYQHGAPAAVILGNEVKAFLCFLLRQRRNGKQQQCRQHGAQQSGSLSFLRVLHYHSTAFLTRRRRAGTPPSDSLCTRV